MNNNITGKRIFLMCERFFGYDIALRDTLLKLGAEDVFLHDVTWLQATLRGKFNKRTIPAIIRHPRGRTQWTEKLKEEIGNRHFDIFLCMPITPFKKSFMKWLRQRNPNIKTILFIWDSVDGIMSYYKDYFPLFDKIYSFDRDDSKRYGFIYQPDFYVSDVTVPYDECEYDMNFIGNLSCNKDVFNRPSVLSYIDTFSKEHHLNSFLYLKYSNYRSKLDRYLGLKSKYERIVDKYFTKDFMNPEAMPLEDVEKLQQNAKIIIDLSHANRQGLTINAITALAKGKKLITTNKRIVEEPFYSPTNIYILDEKNPCLDAEWLKTPPQPVDMSSLRMDNWLRTVLECKY